MPRLGCLTVVIALALGLVVGAPAIALAEGTLSVDPTSGPSGSMVTVTGSGFGASDYPSGLPIQVDVDHGNGNWELLGTVATAQVNTDGTFRVAIQIPAKAPAGLLAISAVTGSGGSPFASFNCTGTQSTPPGQQATTVSVDRAFTTDGTPHELAGFTPGDAVWYVVTVNVTNGPAKMQIRWRAAGPLAIYDFTNPDVVLNNGSEATYSPARIPLDAPFGTYTLTVTVTFNSQVMVKTTTFNVMTPSISQVPTKRTSNYAGYSAVGGGYTHVLADFVVPNENCTSGGSQAGFWVGLGAAGGEALEQIGVTSQCTTISGLRATYVPFWEMIGNGDTGPQKQLLYLVLPGNNMEAEVIASTATSATGSFELVLRNFTLGWTFRTTQPQPHMHGALASADVVAEAPGGGLTNFGQITFTETHANTAPLDRLPASNLLRWIMEGNQAAAGPLSDSASDGARFTVTWNTIS
jgi:Peptidase A4 family